jgi:hypothetical protein
MIITCSSSVVSVPYNCKVELISSSDDVNKYGGPNLDFEFIYRVVENLSNTIKKYPKGRDFGSPGEHYARDLVKGWMEEIGLQNVYIDKITTDWTKKDSWENLHNLLCDPDYHPDGWIENLTLKKNFSKWYLHVKVYDKHDVLIADKNFSQNECFPFLKEEDESGYHNVTLYNVTIVNDFKVGGSDEIVLMEADWRDPYGWWISNITNLKRPNVKGFILMDCFNDTFFMLPSGTSSPSRPRFSKPGFSISGSSGTWIKQYLNSPGYTVKADICSEWTWQRVDSWNVIGEIPGKSSKIAIINDFYDGWWNQATFDEAVGIGTILGIAKYIIDHNITPELTLKFVAWGGHEWYFRGGKHYLKSHNIKKYGCPQRIKPPDDQEDIIYIISPGNYGFNKTRDMSFNVGHKQDIPLMKFMQKVAKELKYTERTGIGITGEDSVYGEETYVFYHGHRYPERYCRHAIEFDRFPYPGYHRDGNDHTKGDVFSDINDTLFRVDCEVIAEIILRLTVPKLQVKITKPMENSLYYKDRRLFTLFKNTIIYGPTDITVDIDSDAGIDKVEFYIDGDLKKTDNAEPYTYRWRALRSFKHTIKAVAYDTNGNYADDEIQVFKWRIHPLLILTGSLLIIKLLDL